MKINSLLIAIICLLPCVAAAVTVDPPHGGAASGYNCANCHTTHAVLGGSGYDNICLNCHRPGSPKGGSRPFTIADGANPFNSMTGALPGRMYQTTHNWTSPDNAPVAGAAPPLMAAMTTNSLAARTGNRLACVRCHNQHDNSNPPFLRVANDRDQMCLDCHRSRNVRNQTAGSHPVNFNYTGAGSKVRTNPSQYFNPPVNANPGNPTADLGRAMGNTGGTLLCSSCHGVHYTDSSSATFDNRSGFYDLDQADGYLLRTDLHGATANAVNICTNCHAGKNAHNGRGQNIQCADCHGGHVEYDANALTAQQKIPNVWLVRRYMRISTAYGSAKNVPVYFQSTTAKNYKDPAGNGVCQSCHEVPVGVGYPDAHSSFAATVCNQCHFHVNSAGAFTATGGSCTSCHGYPPRANTAGGPNGYAVSSPFTSESSSGHAPHAGAAPYSRECRACHQGNSHLSGTFQDVFIDTTGLVSALFGAVPTFIGTNPQAPGCATVYCHSDGAPRNAALVPVLTTQAIPSWANGRGAIIGQPDECRHCHGDATTLSTNSHGRHLAAAIGCVTCHSATAASNTSLKGLLLHANGVKDIGFSNFTSTGKAVWNVTAATCSTLYCHSSAQGASGAGQPAYTVPLWGGAAPGCGGCHKDMKTDPAATGSHSRHAQFAAFACATCHPGYDETTANTATHVNSSINLGFTGAAAGTIYGKGTSYPPGSSAYTSCTAAYCHSTVQGFAGSGAGTFRQTPNWGGLGPLPCGTCHVDMSSNSTATGSHIKHAQTYALSCGVCHGAGYAAATVVYPGHANRSIDLGMNGIANGTAYSKTASFSPGLGYGSCSSSYCHSNGQTPPAFASPVWGGAVVVNCLGCHGNDAATGVPIASGAHTVHINNAAVLGINNNFACGECHARTVAVTDNRTVISVVTHVNGIKDYSGARAGGSVSYNAATKTCSGSYCHSSGMKGIIAASQEPDPPIWSSGALICKACHGSRTVAQGAEFDSVNGEPNYVNGGAGTPTANSHNRHVVAIGITDTSKCSNCHYKTVDKNLASKLKDYSAAIYHLNRSRDVAFRPIDGNTGILNEDTTCSNTYCHGTVSTRWGDAGSSNCASCHSASNVASSPLPGAHHIHYSSSVLPGSFNNSSTNISSKTAYRFSCSTCHAAGINKAVHADGPATSFGVAQVFFSMTSPGRNPVYNYSAATRGVDRTTFKWTAGGSSSCNATYCHSNGTGAKGPGIVRWDDSVTGSCNICHDNTVTLATGAHQGHVNSAAAIGGVNLVCIDCHALTVSSDAFISDKSRHVNKLKDYSGIRAGGSAGYNAVTRVCSVSYCHSNGKGAQTTPPAWNSGVNLNCNGCHGAASSVAGEPDYANGGAGAALANSHQIHVGGRGVTDTTGCVVCHQSTVSGSAANRLVTGSALHLNRQIEVNMSALANRSGIYDPATKTCSSTYCHAGGTPQWGGPTLVCGQCHTTDSTLAGGHAIHYDSLTNPSEYLNFSGNVSTPANYRFTCTSCHNSVHADGPFNAATGQTAAVQFGYTTAIRNGVYTVGTAISTDGQTGLTWTNGSCAVTYCHSDGKGGNPIVASFNWASPTGTLSCTGCHDTKVTGVTATVLSGRHDNHLNTTRNTSLGLDNAFNCVDCHSKTITDINNVTLADKSKHINKLADFSGARAGGSAGYNRASRVCSNVYCHSDGNSGNLVFVSMTGSKNWNGNASFGCNGCHGRTSSFGVPDYANGGPGINANNHARHLSQPGMPASTTACSVCHLKTVSATAAGQFKDFSAAVYHLNGNPSVVFDTVRVGAAAAYSASTCSNVYCHSTVQGAGGSGAPVFQSPVWGQTSTGCNFCHADMSAAAGTGGHEGHVLSSGLTCSVCHGSGYTAATVTYPGHVNNKINLHFTGSGSGTVYANNSTIDPGTAYEACFTSLCHGSIVTATWGVTTPNPKCEKCHGYRSAPWTALNGDTDPFLTTAGTHFSHISSSGAIKYAKPFSCAECHASSISLATESVAAAGHFDTPTPAEPVFGSLARTGGANPVISIPDPVNDPGRVICSNVYCHGATLPASTPPRTDPVWNNPFFDPAGGGFNCSFCHGYPPATGAHVGKGPTDCITCHAHVNASGDGFTNPVLHVNGIIEASGFHTYPNPGAIHLSLPGATTPATSCGTTGCHDFTTAGSYPVSRGTPPNCRACHTTGLLRTVATSSCWDCHGASDIDGKPNGNVFPNISGNHTVHTALTGTSCNTCHTGFGAGSSKHGFSNTSTSAYPIKKVAFTGVGAAPLWTAPARTCSATDCHGQGAPVWGARAGAPVNGFPYAAAQCAKCHGATTSNPFYSNAIPQVSATTDAKVGAHFMHLTSSTIRLSAAVHCDDCHAVPATMTATSHMNGVTELVWSALATNNGSLTPTYNGTTRQCSNVYCHGAAMQIGDTSGTNRTPTWNVPFMPAAISAAACSNCHGFPPPATSGHPAGIVIPPNFGNGTVAIGTTCSCHANINTAGTTYANIFVNKALHINGFFEPTSGAHEFPYSGSLHLSAAGTTPWAGCVNASCHTNGANTTYPVATLTPPDCTGCHLQGLRAPSGTSSCYDCHGANATDGKPNGGIGTGIGGTTFPNYSGSHTVHITNVGLACANCHFNAGAGTIVHGNSNRTLKTAATVAFNGLPSTPTWTSPNCTAACHGAARWGGRLGCISCHSTAQASTHGTPRDAVTTEFGLAWGHKKSGRGAVADADCIVCHLEGDFATQSKSARHGDGNVDLRDPDGVGEAAITNISGAAFTFKRFSTSYASGSRTAAGHLSNTDIANVVTQKFCLACHDSNGATNTTARSNNGGTGTAFMVFGGISLGATYTLLNGAAAAGGVVDAKTQFAIANSSNHPVLGPGSKAYPTPTRLAVPYNNFVRTAGTASSGVVMNCFDCHNTTAPLMTTRTVAAHGNAVTIRGTLYAAATGGNSVASPTFCLACHIGGYNTTSQGHAAGSAISASNSNMSATRFAPCANCHFSSGFKPARPLQAADVHGFNGLAATGGAWTYGNANGMRPVALIRNVGRWVSTSPRPASAPGITAGSANCGGSMNTSTGGVSCNDNMGTYTPGGVY